MRFLREATVSHIFPMHHPTFFFSTYFSSIFTGSSSVSKPKTSYAIGLIQLKREEGASGSGPFAGVSGELRLVPLDSCLQLRPDFSQMDEEANQASGAGGGAGGAAGGAAGSAAGGAAGGAAGAPAVDNAKVTLTSPLTPPPTPPHPPPHPPPPPTPTPHPPQSGLKTDERQATAPLAQVFKRAETEKELEARRLSHAYFQEQQEAEPWSDVRLFPADSEESIKLRQQLFGLDEPHDV